MPTLAVVAFAGRFRHEQGSGLFACCVERPFSEPGGFAVRENQLDGFSAPSGLLFLGL
jgi:hypothetical protein